MKCLAFFSIVVVFCFSFNLSAAQNSKSLTVYPVGVILDMGSPIGKMGQQCMSIAISDFYARHTHYTTKLVLHTRDSLGDPLQALSSAFDLLENDKVKAIIGPETSDEAEFLVGLGDKAKVPIISFSATSPFLSRVKNPYFIRVATNDNSQLRAIAAIVQAFRWREVILIHEDTSYGNGVIPNLIVALEEINARVPYRSVISPIATEDNIAFELYKLVTMSTRVFVVHMSSSLASRIFLKVKEVGMMSKGYAWIITDGITNNLYSMDSSVIDSMQGVIGIRPYITSSEELNNFTLNWGNKFPKINKNVGTDELSVYCLWAYDAVWALAGAAEKVGLVTSQLRKNSTCKSTYLGSLLLSQTGPELLKTISQSKFKGLSGVFQLVNGQVEPVVFQLVNIIGKGVKEIGFWTVKNDISRIFNLSENNIHSDSVSDLEAISWPGVSLLIPNGGLTPVSGKRLRVGVPVKQGFTELIKVDRDLQTNATVVSGFCVDVFKAAIEILPYAVHYDFVPFVKSSGTYNHLIDEVYLQNFDAAVGDITITANRSLYVDFTFSFTEAGVGMVVPIGTAKNRSMWIFFEPLTVDLWLTIGAFFILTGCIVWIIEHGVNIEFKGLLLKQVGMIFWYSFSTLVFAQWEKLMSNLSKFVVIIWLFVVLILTSSYTASLSSTLTLHQLQLVPKGSFIGYPLHPAFQKEVFNNQKCGNVSLESVDEYSAALRKGSKNGGVSAIIDEIPYIKLFLAKYSANYTMVEPSYKSTNGFGFVFPKGSPLVPDISRAIAKLREDGKLDLIEQNWIQNHSVFRVQESEAKPKVLNFYSFRGLFLITGTSSILALIIFCLFMKKGSANEKERGVVTPTVEEHLPDINILPILVISNHPSGGYSIEEEHVRLSRESDVANQLPS